MNKFTLSVFAYVLAANYLADSCLITNCPRGGKRNHGSLEENNVRQCVACGPGKSGQCFGPNICCGSSFGCLIGTPDTVKCQREGMFREREPCVAGSTFCRKNTGRCAADGICCSQDSCHIDKSCSNFDDKLPRLQEGLVPMDLYNVLTSYQGTLEY